MKTFSFTISVLLLFSLLGCDVQDTFDKNRKQVLIDFKSDKKILCQSSRNNKSSFKINKSMYNYVKSNRQFIPIDKNKPYLIFHISECSAFF